MCDDFYQFFLLDSVLNGVTQMKAQLVGTIQGNQRGHGGETAVAPGKLRAFPNIAKEYAFVRSTSFGAKSPSIFCAGVGSLAMIFSPFQRNQRPTNFCSSSG